MSIEEVPRVWMDSCHSVPLCLGAQFWGVWRSDMAALGQALCRSAHPGQELCGASPGPHRGVVSMSCMLSCTICTGTPRCNYMYPELICLSSWGIPREMQDGMYD